MRGLCLSPQVPSLTLFTDASYLSCGAYLKGLTISGVWNQDILEEHINVLEMKAVLLALNHFQLSLKNQSVILATDNTTVVAYLKNRRNSLTFSLSDNQRNSPSVFSTPGSYSGETYCGTPQYSCGHSIYIPCSSKHGVGTTSRSFKSRDLYWGSPQIDLFATSLNHKLPTFVSPVPDS
ncbi:uncharacterized protein [Mytilus edulis]|uniref:uncharacterized protein n=1 Tax=Mytilus edulis TaxID=6550 RepID=UPI0039F1046B